MRGLIAAALAVAFAATVWLFTVWLEPLASSDAAKVPVAVRETTAAVAPPPAPAAAAEAAPEAPPVVGPRVAVLFTDVGADPAQARAAIATLPAAVGFAFTPYSDASQSLAAEARARGQDVWVGVPMQPKSWPRVRPGENTLTVDAAPAENLRRLDWALARVGPAAGITGIMGSALTEDRAALTPLFGALAAKRLAFIDARVSPRSVALDVAERAGVPAALNQVFLDEGAGISRNLRELETAARLNGRAVGFARATPESVAAVNAWAAGLRGVTLVRPGAVVD
jgi:hypothetical protein